MGLRRRRVGRGGRRAKQFLEEFKHAGFQRACSIGAAGGVGFLHGLGENLLRASDDRIDGHEKVSSC